MKLICFSPVSADRISDFYSACCHPWLHPVTVRHPHLSCSLSHDVISTRGNSHYESDATGQQSGSWNFLLLFSSALLPCFSLRFSESIFLDWGWPNRHGSSLSRVDLFHCNQPVLLPTDVKRSCQMITKGNPVHCNQIHVATILWIIIIWSIVLLSSY